MLSQQTILKELAALQRQHEEGIESCHRLRGLILEGVNDQSVNSSHSLPNTDDKVDKQIKALIDRRNRKVFKTKKPAR